MREKNQIARAACWVAAGALLFASTPASRLSAKDPEGNILGTEPPRDPGGRHVSRDFSGVLTTSENLTLHLYTDLGSVRIVPASGEPVVRYSVHVETDARGGLASQLLEHYVLNTKSAPTGVEINGNLPQLPRGGNSQFWVHFEVSVPATYSLDVTTGAGDIQTADVGGTATLTTEGGNIVGGKIGTNLARPGSKSSATRLVGKLETQGGHIQVGDVSGDLSAFTAGGHINTGYILGEANLHSGGGHIRAAGIGGKAELATEGGNITVGKAAKFVQVKTGGGQIDFGEVMGSVHAQTGGGGIRVLYVSGPMDVESSGGSICLTKVSGSVKAATSSGTITAWINPDNSERSQDRVSLPGASQLTSDEGDIVVFLPRKLAATIEAVVENGGAQRIEADPALALQIAKSQRSGPVKAWASLNGGGAVLKLRTSSGKIKLQYLDAEMALWSSMMRDQQVRMERELAMPMPATFAFSDQPYQVAYAPPARNTPNPAPQPTPAPNVAPPAPDQWPGSWVERLEVRILGGVREDGDEFWKRITQHPAPPYPEIARKAGIEGAVRLQVRLTPEGRIEVQKLLEGDTVLADAAIAALKQWRGKPVWMDGKPVDVISTVTFNFKLRD
jgi:TonB family protein